MDAIRFFVVTDRESERPELSNNGGDYDEGRTVAVYNGEPVAVRYWSSWDGGFCNLCGRYEPFECGCQGDGDTKGWETGEELTGDKHEMALARLRLAITGEYPAFGVLAGKGRALKKALAVLPADGGDA